MAHQGSGRLESFQLDTLWPGKTLSKLLTKLDHRLTKSKQIRNCKIKMLTFLAVDEIGHLLTWASTKKKLRCGSEANYDSQNTVFLQLFFF